ncbi:cell division protein FtsA [Fusobacterium sp. PH5-44]|uniref:cell division protein FtsA n=1 Tax=unclassified Fusobacterium TaxID=2648384 RepID=UPI003D24F885
MDNKNNLNKKIIKTVIDIGNRKIKGIIGKMSPDGVSVLEYAEVFSSGIEKSNITNTIELSGALGALIEKLKSNDRPIEKVTIGIGGKNIKTKRVPYKYEFPKKQITEEDIENFFQNAKKEFLNSNEVLLHKEIYNLKIDDSGTIKNVLGKIGSQLLGDVYFIYIEEDEFRKYKDITRKIGLQLEDIVSSAYASALSTLRTDERKQGVALIDIGEGSTDIIIYKYDKLVFMDSIPMGTMNYVNDITFLPAFVSHKTKHSIDNQKTISKKAARDIFDRYRRKEIDVEKAYIKENITYMGDYIREIIDFRNKEIAKLIKELLTNSGLLLTLGKNIVLTGGGSNIEGLCEKIYDFVGKTPKKVLPIKLPGLKENSNSLAAVIGLFGEAIDKEYKKIIGSNLKSSKSNKSSNGSNTIDKRIDNPVNIPDRDKPISLAGEKSPTIAEVKPAIPDPKNILTSKPFDNNRDNALKEILDTHISRNNSSTVNSRPANIDNTLVSANNIDPAENLENIDINHIDGIEIIDDYPRESRVSSIIKNVGSKIKEWTDYFK